MTLIVKDSSLPDPTTNGSEFHDLEDNLGVTRANVDDLGGRVETVKDIVENAKEALEQVDELAEKSDKFLSSIKSMKFTLQITEKVGPLKLVSKFVEGVLDDLETLATHVTYRARQLADKIEKGDYVEKLQRAEDKLGDLEDDLEIAEFKLLEYEDNVTITRVALDVAGTVMDPLSNALDTASTPANDILVPLNRTYADLTELLDSLSGGFFAPAAPDTSIFDAISDLAAQFGKIDASIGFLTGPLQEVYNAVEPVEWALDAVDAVYDVTVGPVVDFVLNTLGITDLMERLGDEIVDALPLNLDGALDGITLGIDGVMGDIDGFLGSVSVAGWDADIDGLIGDITSDIIDRFGSSSTTELRFGGAENDTLEGRDDVTEVLIGLGGADEVRGAPGGGEGNAFDMFVASEGNDTNYGGSGRDWLVLPGTLNDWIVSRFSDTAPMVFYHRGRIWGYEVAYDIENFAFFDGQQTIASLEQLGVITDGQTNNNDLIVGGTGNDTITPLDGTDTVQGGSGRDTYVVSAEQSPGGTNNIRLDQGRTDDKGIAWDQYAFVASEYDYLDSIEDVVAHQNKETRIYGTADDNLLASSDSRDYLKGYEGDDELYGNGNKDFLIGDEGSDTLFGGGDNDTFIGSPAAAGETNIYDGGAGRGRLVYSTQIANYDLYPENNSVGPLTPNGPLRINAATGKIENQTADLSGVIATDTARSIETFVGSDQNDTLYRADIEDLTIDGGGGDDILYSGGARFTTGGTGADRIIVTGSGTSVDGSAGNGEIDTLDLRQLPDVRWELSNTFGRKFDLFAVAGYETERLREFVNGNPTGADVNVRFSGTMTDIEELLLGDLNDEFFHKGEGDVTVYGGAGDDRLGAVKGNGSTQDVEIFGQAGDDYILLENVIGQASGGAGDDEFNIEMAGGDMLFDGGERNDFFFVRRLASNIQGQASIDGGTGYDRVSLDQYVNTNRPMTSVSIDLDSGVVSSTQTNNVVNHKWTVLNIEEVIGTYDTNTYFYGDDTGNRFVGLGGNDFANGRDGNDQLFGGDGRDTIIGGNGDDLIHGGLGDDSLRGDDGIDVVSYANARPGTDRGEIISGNFGGVVVDLTAGLSAGTFGKDKLDQFENVTGSMGADRISGDDKANVLSGGQDDDTLFGGDNTDTLIPGAGDDVLLGGGSNDRFLLGPGSSRILGGGGTDIIDISALSGNQVIDITQTNLLFTLAASKPVWNDTGTEEARTFGGKSITPLDVLEVNPQYANSDDDLTRAIPTEADYQADPTLPSFEISLVQTQVTNQIIHSGVEGFATGAGNDVITGSDTADRLEGGAGNDSLYGGGGSDELFGGDGDDLIYAEGGISAALPQFGETNLLALNGTTQDGGLSATAVSFSGSLTVEMLIKADPLQTAQSPFSYAVNGSTNEFTLFTSAFDSTTLRPVISLIYNGQSFDTDIPADALYDGDLHRLSVSVDQNTTELKIYIDGIKVYSLVDPAFGTSITSGGTPILGQEQDGTTPGGGFDPTQAFKGAVGDLRIFDRALNETEIHQSAFTTKFADPAQITGLTEYWTVDPVAATFGSSISATMTRFGDVQDLTVPGPSTTVYDELQGGDGNDTMIGSNQAEIMLGGAGDDVYIGNNGSDFLVDQAGNDTLNGGGDTDYYDLREDNNLIIIGEGDGWDYIYGFVLGRDRIDLTGLAMTQAEINQATANAVALSNSTEVDFGDGDKLDIQFLSISEVQGLLSNATHNSFTGTTSGDLLDGGAGNDTLQGLSGNDTLLGSFGDDLLLGGPGNNSLSGGDGNDTVQVSGDSTAFAATKLNDGTIQLVGPTGTNLIGSDVEFIQFDNGIAEQAEVAQMGLGTDLVIGTGFLVDGTPGAEILYGTNAANWFTPGGGSDIINGRDGRDMLSFADIPETPGRTNTDYRLTIDMEAGTATSHDGSENISFSNI